MKYWEKLLLSQRSIGKHGLTIPFIIGSQNYLKTDKKDNIEQLILDIIESASFEITLRICSDIHTLVLEKRNLKNLVYYPNLNNSKQSKFSVAKILESDFGKNIEQIIGILTNQFQKTIDDEKYSAQISQDERVVVWDFFSELNDIPFIKNSFQKTEIK